MVPEPDAPRPLLDAVLLLPWPLRPPPLVWVQGVRLRVRDKGPRPAHAAKGVLEAPGGVFFLLLVHAAATAYTNMVRAFAVTAPLAGEPVPPVSVLPRLVVRLVALAPFHAGPGVHHRLGLLLPLPWLLLPPVGPPLDPPLWRPWMLGGAFPPAPVPLVVRALVTPPLQLAALPRLEAFHGLLLRPPHGTAPHHVATRPEAQNVLGVNASTPLGTEGLLRLLPPHGHMQGGNHLQKIGWGACELPPLTCSLLLYAGPLLWAAPVFGGN